MSLSDHITKATWTISMNQNHPFMWWGNCRLISHCDDTVLFVYVRHL